MGRVLDVAPDGALRPKPLAGVDAVEVDLTFINRQNRLRGVDRSAKYSHVVLTGVLEQISRDRLTTLLEWLHGVTASDAVIVLDGLVLDGERLPPVKRWAGLSLTTTRRSAPRHHHLDEVELAVLESDWLLADATVGSNRRSLIKLVKRPDRRADGWLTPSERRALGTTEIERERLRHRLAYEGLLRENADLREAIRKEANKRNAEVRELRKLRSIRGWLGFQKRRLRPKRLMRSVTRRLSSWLK